MKEQLEVIEVLGVIHPGGFGNIEKVKCNDGNYYARKTYSPPTEVLANKDLEERFRIRFVREVKTQKLLPQELFIPIIKEDLEADKPWFLMPLADSVYSTEIEKAKKEKRVPDGLSDILNSLEFIHNRGLVHRDLKPQNILLHEGVWKLADFGLISQDKEILSKSITTSNNAYGTLRYCAPEQITDFKRVTALADIYSFGAILHDIFTNGNRVPCDELSGNGEIGIIIEKCTKKKPEQRFQDIESLRNRLLYILSKESNKKLTSSDAEWIESLKKYDTWDADKLENFIFYLRRNEDLWGDAFIELNNEIIEYFFNLDKSLFDEYCIMYFDWVYKKGFDFDYCDVVVSYIYNIYERISDLEIKTKAVLTAAELGRSHNRWYVMRYVVKMANQQIDDNLAFRISIEIELNKRDKQNFITCAENISVALSSYHPIIANILT